MSSAPTPASPPATPLPPLPTVDPTKHPRLAAILKLVAQYGPWILSLLGSFGVKIPGLPGGIVPGQHGPITAALAPANHDAIEASLAHVDLGVLQAACQQAGV